MVGKKLGLVGIFAALEDPTTPEIPDGDPPKRTRRRSVVVGLSILLLALGVIAWQQGGSDQGGGPLNAIAAAAEKAQREPGGHGALKALVSSEGKSFTITGQMVFDSESGRSRAAMTMPDPQSDGTVEMQIVGDGTVIYMRSDLFGELPDGREWMALDYSLGDDLEMPLPANSNAKDEFALLEATTGVRKVGKDVVRGVPTTLYSGTVGVSEQIARLREMGADHLASLAEEQGNPAQVEAWIDSQGLVRRMQYVVSQPGAEGKGSTTTDMRVDFFDFGTVPEIEVPESSEVFDATDLAREKIDNSGD